jgi:mannose-6-phosphate isomerase-like protein (cupin superfamily)
MVQTDSWVWGDELIVWGFDPSHRYTFKILQPKRGRTGCLSLQYHHQKSESWLVIRGIAWTLVAVDGTVCTRVMRPGDIQNLSAGMIHRVAAVSDDLQIVEPSTPDAHAADKSVPKDVVRLHCVHGRPIDAPRNESEKRVVETAIQYTEEAMQAIEAGKTPPEHNRAFLDTHGASHLGGW